LPLPETNIKLSVISMAVDSSSSANTRRRKAELPDVVRDELISEEFVVNGMQQGHVLSTFDWQLIDGVVVYHLRDAVKRLAELAEDIVAASAAVVIAAHNLHVHETTRTPDSQQTNLSYDVPPDKQAVLGRFHSVIQNTSYK